jgi:NAD dependent epimerase/dehydratase family enzyme
LGGKQVRGHQKVSWIHIDDFCKAVEWIISHESISGTINVTAPNPVSNRDLMTKMKKHLKIPFRLNAPVLQLEIASLF